MVKAKPFVPAGTLNHLSAGAMFLPLQPEPCEPGPPNSLLSGSQPPSVKLGLTMVNGCSSRLDVACAWLLFTCEITGENAMRAQASRPTPSSARMRFERFPANSFLCMLISFLEFLESVRCSALSRSLVRLRRTRGSQGWGGPMRAAHGSTPSLRSSERRRREHAMALAIRHFLNCLYTDRK